MDTHIIFGTSFSPEYANRIGKSLHIDALTQLNIIRNRLGISDIRFGIRWNRTDTGNGRIDLEYYRPYLDFLFENNCTVCLNVGPIKVFRWPEEHIPNYLCRYETDLLSEGTELAKHSYQYLADLIHILNREYGSSIKHITFQVENECFFRFGQRKMLMSEQYIINLARILKNALPDSHLMLDSAGRRNLKKIVRVFNTLTHDIGYKGTSLILGFNYYFTFPRKIPFFRRLDPLIWSSPFDMGIPTLHRIQKEMGFGLEISEGQFEPWGRFRTPGNSWNDFDFLINRSSRFFPIDYKSKLIRLWGTEQFAVKIASQNMTDEHKRIEKFIRENTVYNTKDSDL